MNFSFGKYYFLFWATTLSCHAQPDLDMYALFYSRRSSGGDASSSKSPIFGNIEEELKKTKALQIELNAVKKALDLAYQFDKDQASREAESANAGHNTLRGTITEVVDWETAVEPPRGLKYTKYSYYSSDYYSSKSKSHKSYDYYGSKSHKSKSHKSKSAKKYKDYYGSYYSKKSKSYKSNKAVGELEECQAELAKHENEVSYLFIQTAPACQVQRSADSDGETSYKLVTDSISEDTYVFSDRPYRIEDAVSTANFTAAWSDMFETSNPNVGVTLVSEGEAVGPLVVVFSEPDYQGNGQLAYNIQQSPNQEGVKSIESIFDGTSLDSVPFDSCSFFVDGINRAQKYFYAI